VDKVPVCADLATVTGCKGGFALANCAKSCAAAALRGLPAAVPPSAAHAAGLVDKLSICGTLVKRLPCTGDKKAWMLSNCAASCALHPHARPNRYA
jgi:hypothetical protein